MNISKPIRFREEKEKKESSIRELARVAHPHFKKMSRYAGRALIRK